MEGVHTGGGINGNGNDVVMEWVGYPFCSGNSNGNICIRILPLPLLLTPPV